MTQRKNAPVYALYRDKLRNISEIARLSGRPYGVVRHRILNGIDIDNPVDHRRNPNGKKYREPDFDIDAKHADECVDAAVRAHPDGLTLEEVALLLGKSRERIRQIERDAIRKLRQIDPDACVAIKLLKDAYEQKRDSERANLFDLMDRHSFGWSCESEEMANAAE